MSASDQNASDLPNADHLRVLLGASRRLSAKLTPAELFEAVYRETRETVEAPAFYLAIHDQGRDLARVVYYAEHGVGHHADIPYRGSGSTVLTSQQSAMRSGELEDGSVMTIGETEQSPTRSAIVAPLLHDGRVLGAISAQSYEEDAYTPADLSILESLAGVAAVAIYNAQQFTELDRRRREAEQLEEIGRALTSKLDPDQVVGLVISAVSDVLSVEGVAVWLVDPRHPTLCRVADSGGNLAPEIGTEWELTGDHRERLLNQHTYVLMDDLVRAAPNGGDSPEYPSGGSALGVPLVLGGNVEGVITAASREVRRFTQEDVAVLQRLANQACVALGNARLHANLHALSLTDPLTSLPNRRRLQIHLDHEVAAARRGRAMSIAVFDIDNFKHYNDTFGHIAGDDILRAVGKVLSTENRAMNVVARYGGDEFVSVLSETGIEGARNYAERVEKGVREDETLSKFGITLSIGAAEFDPDTMASVNDVLRAADADMYDAKARRRSQINASP